MGDFRIVIDAVGGHGQDRDKEDGEVVDFGENTPEGFAKKFVGELVARGLAIDVKAKVIHWPMDNYGGPEKNGRIKEVVDDLVTGVRSGSFQDKLNK